MFLKWSLVIPGWMLERVIDPTMAKAGQLHDDVINWKYFPRYWPFLWGIHRSPVNSPHKGQRRVWMSSLICTWTNSWENNRDAGDLRRRRAHYDVNVMLRGVPSFYHNWRHAHGYCQMQPDVKYEIAWICFTNMVNENVFISLPFSSQKCIKCDIW